MISEAKTPSQARPALRSRAARSLTAVAAVAVVGLIAAACGSSTPSASGTGNAATTVAPGGSPGTSSAPESRMQVAKATSNAKIGGTILVNVAGKTLYTFSPDTSSMSACTGACATAWPPVTIPANTIPQGGTGVTGSWGTFTRSDGTVQVTYNGDPLYTFAGDSTAGSASGQNITSDGGTWKVVTIGATTSTPQATTAPTPTMPAVPATTATTKASSGGGYGY
jgi:predicted lipoprotein with Yx(FWY)xxD motif